MELKRPDHWSKDIEVEEGVWRDYYTGEKLANYSYPWYSDHETRYGEDSNCLAYYSDEPKNASWFEWECDGLAFECACQYQREPLIRLQGLCPHSALKGLDQNVGWRFIPIQPKENPLDIFFASGMSSRIDFNKTANQWIISDPVSKVTARSWSGRETYVLGRHKWMVYDDNPKCHPVEGEPYSTQLLFSACQEGEYTCNDGQCIAMKKRCNQYADCRDKSDEINCNLLVIPVGYNRKVPPIKLAQDDTIIPVTVDIAMVLLKIVEIEEEEHSIDFQFEIILKWRDNRVFYHNLKKDTSLNALSEEDVRRLWLPLVIYANTDQKKMTRFRKNDLRKLFCCCYQTGWVSSGSGAQV